MTTDLSRPSGASAAPERSRPRYRASLQQLLSAQKSAQGAPAYSRFVNRPLGRRLAAAAHVLGLTPNQVTATSAAVTGSAVLVVALAPSAWWKGLLVTLLLVLGYALDAADGQLARLRGGGSLVGEWLDHVVDAAKVATLHLAVAVGAFRTFDPVPGAWLLLPLLFSAVGSTWFFTVILNDHLRRASGVRDGQATVTAGEARQHSPLRALASAPADYGVHCLVFVLLGWPLAFQWAYGALALAFTALAAASFVAWFRQVSRLPRPAPGRP